MSPLLLAREEGALPPPMGVQPNFTDPPNINVDIRAVTGTAIITSACFVLARSYTRLFIIKRRGWEDYVLWVAWLLSFAYMLMPALGIPIGAGLHQWDVPKSVFQEFSMRANLAQIFYIPVICMIKLAILIQLLHIFAPLKTKLYWTIIIFSTLNIMFYIACIFFRIFACVPREKIWTPDLPGTCINSNAGNLSSAIMNIVSDFVLLIIPMLRIWRLQISRPRKWAISTIFATGLFGCLASIMRAAVSVRLLRSGDITYELVNEGLWCNAEITSGIVCCCLPVLPQLYRTHLATIFAPFRSRLGFFSTGSRNTTSQTSRDLSKATVASHGLDARPSRKTGTYIELEDDPLAKESIPVPPNRTRNFVVSEGPHASTDNSLRDVEDGRIMTTKSFLIESSPAG